MTVEVPGYKAYSATVTLAKRLIMGLILLEKV